jgi:hypothetical protein
MTRLLRLCVPVLCAGLVPTLTVAAQQAPAAPPAAPGAARPAPPPYVPKNLKVLPDNTDLRVVMRGFAGALGVDCEFCHAAADPVTHREGDRASDANPMKDKARAMIRMTDDLNEKYLAQMSDRHPDVSINCGTCHRGAKLPTAFVPPPRQPGNRPPGAPPAGPPPAGAPPAGAPPAGAPLAGPPAAPPAN